MHTITEYYIKIFKKYIEYLEKYIYNKINRLYLLSINWVVLYILA